jgi:hypothetical protein
MSVSAISAPVPVKAPEPVQTKAPDVKTDAANDDAGAAPKPVSAPLPPGQGTRIDQLV